MQKLRESRFISHNLDKWNRIEAGVNNNSMSPDELENSFVELNEDLGYAKTFYPNRSVKVFINNLLTPVYSKMYKARPWKWTAIKDFFVKDVPLMMAQSMKYLLASLLAVVIGFGLGYYGTHKDRSFAETVLSPRYVAQTEQNIKKGDPMAIYKSADEHQMFLSIFTNNLKVGIMVFALGALLCIGAIYVMFINGVMLGVFTCFMFSHNVTREFGLTVFQHGTLEILGMVIEGAAGMLIGGGILFPGTLSRMRSMQNNAQKGVKILIVCLPIILIAAFIESYITRHTEWSTASRLSIIIASFLLITFYFIVFPLIRFRKNKTIEGEETYEDPDVVITFSTKSINTVGNIFLFAFSYLKRNIKVALICSILLCTAGLWIIYYLYGENIFISNIRTEMNLTATNVLEQGLSMSAVSALIGGIGKFVFMSFWLCKFLFNFSEFGYLTLLVFPTLCYILFILRKRNNYDHKNTKEILLTSIMAALFPTLLFMGTTWLFGSAWWLSVMFVLPFAVIWASYMAFFKANIIRSFLNSFQLLFTNFWKFTGCVTLIFILYFILSIGVWFFVIQITGLIQGINPGMGMYSDSTINLLLRICYFTAPIMLTLIYFIFTFFMFSAVERSEGVAIMENLGKISFRKEVYGVETE